MINIVIINIEEKEKIQNGNVKLLINGFKLPQNMGFTQQKEKNQNRE